MTSPAPSSPPPAEAEKALANLEERFHRLSLYCLPPDQDAILRELAIVRLAIRSSPADTGEV